MRYTKYTCIHASAFVLWDVACLGMSSAMHLPCCAICSSSSVTFFPSVSFFWVVVKTFVLRFPPLSHIIGKWVCIR